MHLSLDGRRDIGGQLYRQLRDAVLDGRLRAREALPSSREVAAGLGISRSTVLLVYERLRAEGFVAPKVGAGTFVAEGIRTRAARAPRPSPLRPRALWDEIPDGYDMAATRPDFDFRPGVPDVAAFPFAAWRSRVAREFHPAAIGAGLYANAAGHAGLRAAIARHVGVARAVRASAEDVVVTNGSQQAIDLLAKVLLAPQDLVAVEDPGYPLPLRAFRAHGCRVVGVPVDAEGLVVDAIPAGVRLVYVTPSHQYPLGVAMSMARRQALLAWARRADGIIIEDDYDSEFGFGGRPLEPLQSLDAAGRVIYVGTFSKTMLPTIRLGFLVAPESLRSALRKAKHLTDWHAPLPLQGAAAAFIDDGLLAQHVRRMRRVYTERHRLVCELLARDFGDVLTVLPSPGGLHVAARLGRRRGGDLAIAERAAERGIAILTLSRHYVTSRPRPGFLFGYGAIPTARIAAGLAALRRAF